MIQPRIRQQGMALISTLLVFAIAATLTSHMLMQSQASIAKSHWQLDEAQARQDALYAELVTRQAIAEALKAPDKNLTKLLSSPKQVSTTHSTIQWQLVDLQSRVNLNNLITEGSQASAAQRFLMQQQWDQSAIESLKDWLDHNPLPHPQGAEDSHYQRLAPSYQTANQRLFHISTLRAVVNIDASQFDSVSPWVSSLPEVTAININSAPETVIAALHSELDASQVIASREQLTQGFSSTDSFLQSDVTAGLEIDPQMITVHSQFFELQITVSYRAQQEQLRKLSLRTQFQISDNDIDILQRSFGEKFETIKNATTLATDGNTAA